MLGIFLSTGVATIAATDSEDATPPAPLTASVWCRRARHTREGSVAARDSGVLPDIGDAAAEGAARRLVPQLNSASWSFILNRAGSSEPGAPAPREATLACMSWLQRSKFAGPPFNSGGVAGDSGDPELGYFRGWFETGYTC